MLADANLAKRPGGVGDDNHSRTPDPSQALTLAQIENTKPPYCSNCCFCVSCILGSILALVVSAVIVFLFVFYPLMLMLALIGSAPIVWFVYTQTNCCSQHAEYLRKAIPEAQQSLRRVNSAALLSALSGRPVPKYHASPRVSPVQYGNTRTGGSFHRLPEAVSRKWASRRVNLPSPGTADQDGHRPHTVLESMLGADHSPQQQQQQHQQPASGSLHRLSPVSLGANAPTLNLNSSNRSPTPPGQARQISNHRRMLQFGLTGGGAGTLDPQHQYHHQQQHQQQTGQGQQGCHNSDTDSALVPLSPDGLAPPVELRRSRSAISFHAMHSHRGL